MPRERVALHPLNTHLPSPLRFLIGQRWRSPSESELGLGLVREVQERTVLLEFVAAGTLRQYEINDAPLERIRLSPGQSFSVSDGDFKIDRVTEQDGLLRYHCGDTCLPEEELPSFIDLGGPMHRLLNRQLDPLPWFDLRHEAILAQHHALSSPFRGFQGGRIQLYPHQLDLAQRLCQRRNIRVMLADEVGLGKTIEAALIAHRLLLTGRIHRVLIVVPPALTQQWFVEFYLRFNLSFKLVEAEDLLTVEDREQGLFSQAHMIISTEQLLEADWTSEPWDLLIADEVHHLNENQESTKVLKQLCHKAEHVLLLSATPPNLDDEQHFKRLQWLEPERYNELDRYRSELKDLRELAGIQRQLDGERNLNKTQLKRLAKFLKDPSIVQVDSDEQLKLKASWSLRLLDLHGPGYHLVRNTRLAVGGFPERHAHLIELEGDSQRQLKEFLYEEDIDTSFRYVGLEDDPRLVWLKELSQSLEPKDKILVLCHNRHKCDAIANVLDHHLRSKVARFHEEQSLMERDRQAAWFNEEEGPNILVSSAIGAEGRNFQVAHHLVLLDIPINPAALEQRIGRLDRIGQTHPIEIYIPYLKNSPQEFVCRWHHEVFKAFSQSWCGVDQVHQAQRKMLLDVCLNKGRGWEVCLKQSTEAYAHLLDELHQGRDQLLERCAWNRERAEKLALDVELEDRDLSLEHLMTRIWERSGIDANLFKKRTYRLRANIFYTLPFPAFRDRGMSVTFDRELSLRKDDVSFLSWDHPMVRNGLDQVTIRDLGKASMGILLAARNNTLLEGLFVLRHRCPARLAADRYLPPTPLRLALDQEGRSIKLNQSKIKDQLLPLESWNIAQKELQTWLEKQVQILRELAQQQAQSSIQAARDHLRKDREQSLRRLEDLAKLNPSVTDQDVANHRHDFDELEQGLLDPVLELDALRLILCQASKISN